MSKVELVFFIQVQLLFEMKSLLLFGIIFFLSNSFNLNNAYKNNRITKYGKILEVIASINDGSKDLCPGDQ